MERTAVCALSLPIWRRLSLKFRLSLDRSIKQRRPGRSRERGSLSIPGCCSCSPHGRREARGAGSRIPRSSPAPLLARPAPARGQALPGQRCRRSLLALLSWKRLFQPGPGTDRCVWVRSGGCGGAGHTEQHGRSVSTRRAGCAQAVLTFAGVVAARRAGQAMRETCNTPGEWPAKGRGERQRLCPGIPSSVHCTEVKFSKTP